MDNNLTNTLSENCTLVRLTAKHPSGLKVDKELRGKLAEQLGIADERLVNVNKHIYGFDINKYFRRILNSFRNGYYKPLTLAWSDNSTDEYGKTVSGWRLCPNTNLENLQKQVDKSTIEWETEVKSFLKNYSAMLDGAERNLGSAFKDSDYESVDQLKDKFLFRLELSLIPQINDDIRLNVSKELRERIEGDAVNRANNNIKNVLVMTVEALVEQVEHVASKLEEYDPKEKSKSFFNKSSFDKLRQAVEVLPSINSDVLGKNKNIEQAHQALINVFATIDSVESLRDDTVLGDDKRKKVAKDLTGAVGGLKGGFLDKAFGGSKND